jgi:hypothetical protein
MVSFTKHHVLQMNSLNTLFTPTPIPNDTLTLLVELWIGKLYSPTEATTYMSSPAFRTKKKQERILVHQILIEC